MELCTTNISHANLKIIHKGQGIYSFDMYGFAKALTNDGTTLTRLVKVRQQNFYLSCRKFVSQQSIRGEGQYRDDYRSGGPKVHTPSIKILSSFQTL